MTTDDRRSRSSIEALVDALDEAPIDDELAREMVSKMGIDVKALAATLRTKVAEHDAFARERRIHQARKAYAEEIERLERQKHAPVKSRDELLVTFQALLAKAPPNAVAVHFHKYEAATDDELAELIRALRHLLDEDESE